MENIGAGKSMKRVTAKNCQEFNMNFGNSFVRYVRLLDQQENIFRQGRDFQALCEGLRSFRNINKVSALVDFDPFSDYMLHKSPLQYDYIDGHQWYNTRSGREFGLTVPPSRWCRRPQKTECHRAVHQTELSSGFRQTTSRLRKDFSER